MAGVRRFLVMRSVITICALAALLAGCASDDPYEGRGAIGSGATGTESGPPQWDTWENEFPRPPGSTPGTHPSDPRGGIGADDAATQRSPQWESSVRREFRALLRQRLPDEFPL